MGEKGIGPIVDRFLRNNYLFALEFQEGFVFGRVIRRRICRYKYPLVDANGTAVDINAASSQSELRFRDPRNTKNDILYLDTTTNDCYPWFLHGSIGMKPQWIYLYPRYPSGSNIYGKFPNIDPIRPSSGDEISIINSEVSPYEQPTDYLEYVIMPSKTLGAEYYNKDPDCNHQPVLNILFAVYWFQALDKVKNTQLIADIANKRGLGAQAAFFTVGWGDAPDSIGDTLKKDWAVEPMKLEDAAALGGR